MEKYYKSSDSEHFYKVLKNGNLLHINVFGPLINEVSGMVLQMNGQKSITCLQEEFEDAMRQTILDLGIWEFMIPVTNDN